MNLEIKQYTRELPIRKHSTPLSHPLISSTTTNSCANNLKTLPQLPPRPPENNHPRAPTTPRPPAPLRLVRRTGSRGGADHRVTAERIFNLRAAPRAPPGAAPIIRARGESWKARVLNRNNAPRDPAADSARALPRGVIMYSGGRPPPGRGERRSHAMGIVTDVNYPFCAGKHIHRPSPRAAPLPASLPPPRERRPCARAYVRAIKQFRASLRGRLIAARAAA